MKPTQEQLNDPKWWRDSAPEGAEGWVDDCFVKWDEGREYIFTDSGWMTEAFPWTMQQYKNDSGFCVAERPIKPAFVPEVGEWCETSGGAVVFYVGVNVDGSYVLSLKNGGLTSTDTLEGFRPIKSEREKFVEAYKEIEAEAASKQGRLVDALYDSGKFKLMEDGK